MLTEAELNNIIQKVPNLKIQKAAIESALAVVNDNLATEQLRRKVILEGLDMMQKYGWEIVLKKESTQAAFHLSRAFIARQHSGRFCAGADIFLKQDVLPMMATPTNLPDDSLKTQLFNKMSEEIANEYFM